MGEEPNHTTTRKPGPFKIIKKLSGQATTYVIFLPDVLRALRFPLRCIGLSRNAPHFYSPNADLIFTSAAGYIVSSYMPTTIKGGALSLQSSHRMGDRRFAKNLSTSLFIKDLLNETTLSQIHLAG